MQYVSFNDSKNTFIRTWIPVENLMKSKFFKTSLETKVGINDGLKSVYVEDAVIALNIFTNRFSLKSSEDKLTELIIKDRLQIDISKEDILSLTINNDNDLNIILQFINSNLQWDRDLVNFYLNNMSENYSLKDQSEETIKFLLETQTEPILILTNEDGNIKIWNFQLNQTEDLIKDIDFVTDLTLSPDNKYLALSTNSKILIWNLNNFELKTSLINDNKLAPPVHISFSPDNKYLATVIPSNTIKIYTRDNFESFRTLFDTGSIFTISFSLDNKYLVSGGTDNNIKIWYIYDNSFKKIKVLTGHTKPISSFSFSNNYLASGSEDKTIKIWNSFDFELITTLTDNIEISALAFTSDSNYLASGTINTIKIWIVQDSNFKLISTLTHNGFIFRLFFSFDNKFLISLADEENVKIWSMNDIDYSDASNIKPIKLYKRFDNNITHACFTYKYTNNYYKILRLMKN